MKRALCAVGWTTLLLAAPAAANTDTPETVKKALAKASSDNTRALVVFGDDGVRAILAKELSRLVSYEYEKVELDADDAYAAQVWPERANSAGFVAVLAADEKVVAKVMTKDVANKAGLEAFLDKHKAEPLNAMQVYADGLMTAAKSKRRAFVHFSAPW